MSGDYFWVLSLNYHNIPGMHLIVFHGGHFCISTVHVAKHKIYIIISVSHTILYSFYHFIEISSIYKEATISNDTNDLISSKT